MDVDIRAILPHRHPFLMVDAFVSQEGDEFECIKNVSHNEPFFQGHFPEEPVMPGVMIVEALAQAAAVGLSVRERQRANGQGEQDGGGPSGAAMDEVGSGAEPQLGYLAAVDSAKFRRKVVPGDVLRLTGRILLFRRGLCKVEASALVGAEVAAQANLSFVFAR